MRCVTMLPTMCSWACDAGPPPLMQGIEEFTMIATREEGPGCRNTCAGVAEVRVALAWLCVCAASCGMAYVTALWAGV